eukprot:216987-Amphidinium_carterae.1
MSFAAAFFGNHLGALGTQALDTIGSVLCCIEERLRLPALVLDDWAASMNLGQWKQLGRAL